jgi:alpha,alpha-trehalase
MKKQLVLLLLLIKFTVYPQQQSPRQLYPGLFEQVEMTRVFGDSKIFPDSFGRTNGILLSLMNRYK